MDARRSDSLGGQWETGEVGEVGLTIEAGRAIIGSADSGISTSRLNGRTGRGVGCHTCGGPGSKHTEGTTNPGDLGVR